MNFAIERVKWFQDGLPAQSRHPWIWRPETNLEEDQLEAWRGENGKPDTAFEMNV
jgi:hypothetical protein